MSRYLVPAVIIVLAGACAEPAARASGDADPATGRGLDAQAMVECFQPLHDWLVEQNRGRAHTLPEL